MEINKSLVTSALVLLLQFTISCEAALSNRQQSIESPLPPDSLCEGDTCHVSPDNFMYLQSILQSHRLIVFNGPKYSMDERNDFLVIENVSNLTISGGENGSLIECSPQSATFGIHLKNSTNVTLTGLRIIHCGTPFPEYLVQFPKKLLHYRDTTILLEATDHIVLSGIHIGYSPGYSLAAVPYDEYSADPFFFNDNVPSLHLTDCTISHGGIEVHGIAHVLIERTEFSGVTLESYNADVLIKNIDAISSTFYFERGHVMFKERLTMNQSTLNVVGQDTLYIHSSKVLFFESSASFWHITEMCIVKSSVLFRKCYSKLFNSSVTIYNSTVTFTESNEDWTINYSQIDMKNESSLVIVNNSGTGDKGVITFDTSLWKMSPDSNLLVADNNNFPIIFSYSNVSLCGTVRIANNSNSNIFFGAINMFSSTMLFQGSLEMVGNRGNIGGIIATNSELFIYGNATFSDNHAYNGGAVNLVSSFMYISPTATVEFIRNQAQRLGGAIYISNRRIKEVCGFQSAITMCALQVAPLSLQESIDTPTCPLFSLTFTQNKAGIAGNAIYGGLTSNCIINSCNCFIPDVSDIFQYNGVNDSSDLSSFTSDPTRVCFCENGVPNCDIILNLLILYPGEHFNISLAVVGFGLGTVPGSVVFRSEILFGEFEYSKEIKGRVCQDMEYLIVSERDGGTIAFAADFQSFMYSKNDAFLSAQVRSDKEPVSFNSIEQFLVDNFFHIPVFVEVSLLPCPVGFQLLRGSCVCHQILLDNNIHNCHISQGTVFISNGTAFISRPAPYWIGLPNNINSSILIHPQCPFDYCQSEDLNITVNFPNTQCQYHRSGVLCGSCHKGLSMILGSSECKTCSNVYLVSICIFILVGMALVILFTLLNMTVSVGTLNGLILLANILQANRDTFLPPTAHHTSVLTTFLSVFVSWLNLDLGIPMCFFDGLTTYFKTWLQFVFPLYILALVGVMIIASNYSTRVTRLLGTNTVSVLATLILLSYTKILRTFITAFSFTTIIGSQGYHSVVWLPDGNIKYFEPKHTALFLVALVVLLLFGVPYTVTLTAAPWIQRSRFQRVSSLYNRFKPLFDAYMGPYKDSCRYWTGMLLLARVVLIVLFSSFANTNTVAGPQLNLLLLVLSSSALLALTTALKPYRNKLLNGLEIFHLTILLMFSSSNLYVSSIGIGVEAREYIYVSLIGICFIVFLGVCVGHVWYKARRARTGRRPEPPQEMEEEERYPLWRVARVRAEDEEEEEVTIPTAEANKTISEGGANYRDSALDLVSLDQ